MYHYGVHVGNIMKTIGRQLAQCNQSRDGTSWHSFFEQSCPLPASSTLPLHTIDFVFQWMSSLVGSNKNKVCRLRSHPC